MNLSQNKFRGCLLGLAIGDALGTTVEFSPRGSFTPLTDIVGGGPFNLKAGEWTDDTSMALCLGYSLIECDGMDLHDQLDRYVDWWKNGYNSVNGTCFDIGCTVSSALRSYQQTNNPHSGSTDPMSAGNGSIMRLAPVPLFFASDSTVACEAAAESSRTTHGAPQAVDACRLFSHLIIQALNAERTEDKEYLFSEPRLENLGPAIECIAQGDYQNKTEAEIKGSGYVVESLEAALWSFWNSSNFEEGALLAVNLGDDADTTGAIYGQIAGAHYGVDAIPYHWLEKLAWREDISTLADQLYQHATNTKTKLI